MRIQTASACVTYVNSTLINLCRDEVSPPDIAPQLLDHVVQAAALQCFSGICCLVFCQCHLLKTYREHVTLYSFSTDAFCQLRIPQGVMTRLTVRRGRLHVASLMIQPISQAVRQLSLMVFTIMQLETGLHLKMALCVQQSVSRDRTYSSKLSDVPNMCCACFRAKGMLTSC